MAPSAAESNKPRGAERLPHGHAAALPSEAQIRGLVYEWYRKLDVHAPVEELLGSLSEDLEMVLPETTLHGLEAFRAWYEGGSNTLGLPGVINIFFDEKHELKRLDVTIAATGDAAQWRAELTLVVRWEARRWKPPAAASQYLGFDAWQRWLLVLQPQTNRAVVKRYIVEALELLPGSVAL